MPEPEKTWEEIIRENNEPGSPNILVTLEEAIEEVSKHPDLYNKAFILLYDDKEPDKIYTSWYNAGLRFSEIVFLFEYLKPDFISAMKRGPEDDD